MTGLKNKITDDLKDSMKKGETLRTSTFRMLLAAIHNKEIELRKKEVGLTEKEIMDVIRSEAKKRRDAIEGFEKGGRPELAQQEKDELIILQSYLPPEISEEEIEKVVKETIEELKAESQKDFGRVIKEVMAKLKEKTSGERVSKIIKQLLQ